MSYRSAPPDSVVEHDKHEGVSRIHEPAVGILLGVGEAGLAPKPRRLNHNRAVLLPALFRHDPQWKEIGLNVDAEGKAELAGIVEGGLRPEGVPGQDVPVGHGIKLDLPPEQEPPPAEGGHLLPGELQGLLGTKRAGLPRLRVHLRGEDRPLPGDHRERGSEGRDVEVDPGDPGGLELGRPLPGHPADLGLEVVPPGRVALARAFAAGEEDRRGRGRLPPLVQGVL